MRADDANRPTVGPGVVLPELSYRIMGAIFEVHKTLGPGFLESVYRKALVEELRRQGLKVETEKPVELSYKNKRIGQHRLDILVDGQVILELKTAVSFCKAHRDQLMSYLRATDCPLGILVNFAGPRVQYQRVLNPGRSRDSAHSSDSSHSGDSSHS